MKHGSGNMDVSNPKNPDPPGQTPKKGSLKNRWNRYPMTSQGFLGKTSFLENMVMFYTSLMSPKSPRCPSDPSALETSNIGWSQEVSSPSGQLQGSRVPITYRKFCGLPQKNPFVLGPSKKGRDPCHSVRGPRKTSVTWGRVSALWSSVSFNNVWLLDLNSFWN